MRQVSPSFFVRALSQCGKQNVQENRGGEFIEGVAIEGGLDWRITVSRQAVFFCRVK